MHALCPPSSTARRRCPSLPCSQLDRNSEGTQWTLAHAKVASEEPAALKEAEGANRGGRGGSGSSAGEVDANYALFTPTGVSLSNPEANVGVATFNPGATTGGRKVRPQTGAWQRSTANCRSQRRRGLMAGSDCGTGGGGGGDTGGNGGSGGGGNDGGNGGNGDGRDCKIRWVRNKDGRRVKRRVCTGSG